jgi:hypothetical protein
MSEFLVAHLNCNKSELLVQGTLVREIILKREPLVRGIWSLEPSVCPDLAHSVCRGTVRIATMGMPHERHFETWRPPAYYDDNNGFVDYLQ